MSDSLILSVDKMIHKAYQRTIDQNYDTVTPVLVTEK